MIAYFIFIIAWAIVGLVFAIPYTFLSGGNNDHATTTMWLAPVAIIILVACYFLDRHKKHKPRRLGGLKFWTAITFFCLPILLNGVSWLFSKVGLTLLSEAVFAGRYLALPTMPVTLIASLLLMAIIGDALHYFRNHDGPPTNSPPHDPKGGDLIKITPRNMNPKKPTGLHAISI